jgi:hypothetical protein
MNEIQQTMIPFASYATHVFQPFDAVRFNFTRNGARYDLRFNGITLTQQQPSSRLPVKSAIQVTGHQPKS